MKKILISILGIFFGLSTFVSADYFYTGYCRAGGNSNGEIGVNLCNNIESSVIQVTGIMFGRTHTWNFSMDTDYYLKDLSDNSILLTGSGLFSNIELTSVSFDIPYGSCYRFYLKDKTNSCIDVFSGDIVTGFTFVSNRGFGAIDYSVLSLDSFKINYGNQSQEYELSEDIEIFINSPVVKNGNSYSYDGATGINLVYNGNYNWYNKNKLYLDGSFRYSQGVFTPICLN